MYSWKYFPSSARSHWLLRGQLTSNNGTVSRQNLYKSMTSEGNRELFPANIDRSRELFSKICKRKRFFFVSYIILFPKNLNVSQINCFLRNQSIRFYLCLLVQKHNKNTYGLLLFKVFLYSEENEDFGYPLLSSIIFITTIQTTQK